MNKVSITVAVALLTVPSFGQSITGGAGGVPSIAATTPICQSGSPGATTLSLCVPTNIPNLVTVNLNAAAPPTAISGTVVQAFGADATIGRVMAGSYGAIAAVTVARADGTGASPTQVLSGEQIGGINSYAYGSGAWQGAITSLRSYAAENIDSTHYGSKICLATTPLASTTMADNLCVDSTGLSTLTSLTVGTSNPFTVSAAGAVAGKTLALGGATSTHALDVTGAGAFSGNVSTSSSFIGGGFIYINSLSNGILSSQAAGQIQAGASDVNGTPVAQTLQAQSAITGTDLAGSNFTINASRGTGAGVAGNIVFNGAPHGSTGSSQNAYAPILTLNGDTKAVTFNGLGGSTAIQNSGSNAALISTNMLLVGGNSVTQLGISTAGIVTRNTYVIGWSADGNVAGSPVSLLSGNGANAVRVGAYPSATPAAMNTLIIGESPRSGTDVDTAAGGGTIRSALSTGAATNPDLVFQTGVKTTTGSALGTATTAFTIKGETQAAVFTGAVTAPTLTANSAVSLIVGASTRFSVLSSGTTTIGDPLVGASGGLTVNKSSTTGGDVVFATNHASSGAAFSETVVAGGASVAYSFTGGNVNFGSGSGISIGGVAGITKTCTVIPTGITISSGVITAVTGGTCT